jgi:hypothetical protein
VEPVSDPLEVKRCIRMGSSAPRVFCRRRMICTDDGWLTVPVSKGQTATARLQQRLDDWYLEDVSLDETLRRLSYDTDCFLRGPMPPNN